VFQTKFVEKIKIYIINFLSENRAFCEIMWEHMVEPHRLQMTNTVQNRCDLLAV